MVQWDSKEFQLVKVNDDCLLTFYLTRDNKLTNESLQSLLVILHKTVPSWSQTQVDGTFHTASLCEHLALFAAFS